MVFMSPLVYFLTMNRREDLKTMLQEKITKSVARIKANKQKKLILGDTSAKIDWGTLKNICKLPGL